MSLLAQNYPALKSYERAFHFWKWLQDEGAGGRLDLPPEFQAVRDILLEQWDESSPDTAEEFREMLQRIREAASALSLVLDTGNPDHVGL